MDWVLGGVCLGAFPLPIHFATAAWEADRMQVTSCVLIHTEAWNVFAAEQCRWAGWRTVRISLCTQWGGPAGGRFTTSLMTKIND